MLSSKLSSRVQIQAQTAAVDAAGQPIQTWADVCTVWADVRHQQGLEAIKADVLTSVVKASIRIRYREGILPSQRVTYNGTIYEIAAVLPDPSGRYYLDLICHTGASQG